MSWLSAILVALSGVGGGETVLLDFSADWCSPCRQMAPLVHQLQAEGYPVRQVNVDHEPALAQKHRADRLPCFVMLVEGREVDRVIGMTSKDRLRQMLAKAGPNRPAAAPRGGGSPPGTPAVPRPPGNAAAAPPWQSHAAGTRPAAKAAPSAADDLSDIERRALAASVRLKVQDPSGFSYGSGTVIDVQKEDALVLTCGHIFRDSRGQGQIAVDFVTPGAPQGLTGRVIGYDLQRDVGLVAVRTGAAVKPARIAPVGYRPRVGDRVFSIGCNHGKEASVERSRVTSLDRFLGPPNLQAAGQPVVGRSGGGLFSGEGFIVGVCNAADPEDNQGLYAAVGSIHETLDEYKLSRVYEKSTQHEPIDSRLAGSGLPTMPDSMPRSEGLPSALSMAPSPSRAETAGLPWIDRGARADVPAGALAVGGAAMSAAELEALAALRDQSAEVVLTIQSRQDPRRAPRDIVVKEASPEFLRQLAALKQTTGQQLFTSERRERSGGPGRNARPRDATTSPTAPQAAAPQHKPWDATSNREAPRAAADPNWTPKWRKPAKSGAR